MDHKTWVADTVTAPSVAYSGSDDGTEGRPQVNLVDDGYRPVDDKGRMVRISEAKTSGRSAVEEWQLAMPHNATGATTDQDWQQDMATLLRLTGPLEAARTHAMGFLNTAKTYAQSAAEAKWAKLPSKMKTDLELATDALMCAEGLCSTIQAGRPDFSQVSFVTKVVENQARDYHDRYPNGSEDLQRSLTGARSAVEDANFHVEAYQKSQADLEKKMLA